MNLLLTILALVHFCHASSAKKFKSTEPEPKKIAYNILEPIDYKTISSDEFSKFYLSGLASFNNKIFAISDREQSKDIFEVDWDKGKFLKYMPFETTDKINIKALDVCDNNFYLSNVRNDNVYLVKTGQPLEKIAIDLKQIKVRRGFFDGGSGFRGLALDCAHHVLYLSNAVNPRFLISYNLDTKKILKKWDISQKDSHQFSDLKYENGFLYALEGDGMTIAKINVNTQEVVAKYSYQNIEKYPGYIYGPTHKAAGEALLLTEKEIWIGFNPNGLQITRKAEADMKIKGRKSLIVRFLRPETF